MNLFKLMFKLCSKDVIQIVDDDGVIYQGLAELFIDVSHPYIYRSVCYITPIIQNDDIVLKIRLK